MAFFPAVSCTVVTSFTWLKKWLHNDKFLMVWWVNLRHSGSCFTVCLHVCWVSDFSNNIRCNPYVTEKSSTDAKSIKCLRFALNLDLLRSLQMLCFKLWPSAPRKFNVYHHVIAFVEFHGWNQQCVKQPEKRSHSKGLLGSIVHDTKTCISFSVLDWLECCWIMV